VRLSLKLFTSFFLIAASVSVAWPQIGRYLTGGPSDNGKTHAAGLGEPMFFTAGVSLWGPIILRLGSTVLAFYLIVLTFKMLAKNSRDMHQIMNLNSDLLPSSSNVRMWRFLQFPADYAPTAQNSTWLKQFRIICDWLSANITWHPIRVLNRQDRIVHSKRLTNYCGGLIIAAECGLDYYDRSSQP
jgi:hypothetical protein